MHQYLDLVRTILACGSWQTNRTGIRSISMPGAMLRFDLQQGFPAITTRKLAFKSAVAEMVGFLRGLSSARDFRDLGTRVWDQNANENQQWLDNPYRQGEDDLGPVYGVQWRSWPAYKVLDESRQAAAIANAESRGFRPIARFAEQDQTKVLLHKPVDQLRQCLDTIISNPTDRRILFHAWNCAELDQMALPPCHLLYQFLPNAERRELSLCMYVRSNDIGLGAGFNLAEGASLLHLVGRLTGYAPKWFTYFIGDAHIYETHLPMLEEQLQREPYPSPRLELSARIPDYAQTGQYEPHWLASVEPADFKLVGYTHHLPLSAPMAV